MGRGRHHHHQPDLLDDRGPMEEDSAESTRMKASVRLGMWDFAQCDPKRCSGRRLCRLQVIEEFKLSTRFRGIILTYKQQAYDCID